MRMAILGVLLAFCAGTALAQSQKKPAGKPQLKQEDHQRMRDDMREVNRGQRAERQRPMTPQEREKLRQDIHDANRNLKR